jgi:hypothetical protein
MEEEPESFSNPCSIRKNPFRNLWWKRLLSGNPVRPIFLAEIEDGRPPIRPMREKARFF